MKKRPLKGEGYYPLFASDVKKNDSPPLEIDSVLVEYKDGGYEIIANDGIGYDCYWSENLNAWVFSVNCYHEHAAKQTSHHEA